MAGSISQQLEELLNPLPKFVDPEDDQDEETKAKVIELFDDDDDGDGEDGKALSGLRKQATALLPETDRRYLGKATSRKELQREMAGSGEEEEDDDDDEEEVDEDAHEKEEEEEDEEEEDDPIDEDDDGGDDEEDDELGTSVQNGLSEIRGLVSKMKRTDITFPTVTDFQKLTEGMDDLGDSEEDMEESGEEDGESEEEEGGESGEEEDEAEEEDEEDAGAVMTFSKEKVDEEVEKGKAVKDQLALWDQLLEGRIKIQKALVTANQLPQQQTFPEFKKRGGAQFAGALKNSHKALKALQRSLLELQDQLLYQKPDTRPLSLDKTWGAPSEDEEISSDAEGQEAPGAARSGGGGEEGAGPPKRKLEMAAYPGFMAKRFAAFQPYRDATLQKWHDKTRLTMGKSSKGFGAFERSILTQVEQVLLDKERLLRRTQTRRSEYRVLGRPEASAPRPEPGGAAEEEEEGEATEQQLKANSHLKDLDEEIFDDDDFYHQLLRELIERKTSAADPNDQVAMGRQWLAIQKLRSKIKKKVDTKASKGRKVRFQVHSKLLNFMAPIDHSSMNDDARTELYRSLFGKNSFSDGAVPE